MPFADIHEYADAIRGELARVGLVSEVSKVTVIIKDRRRAKAGTIRAYNIRFPSGAALSVEEIISVVDGAILRHKYSYHFQHGLFFFRYDKDVEAALGREYAHAPCHLHVSGPGHEDMRYITHETSFEEVFRFIQASLTA